MKQGTNSRRVGLLYKKIRIHAGPGVSQEWRAAVCINVLHVGDMWLSVREICRVPGTVTHYHKEAHKGQQEEFRLKKKVL